MTALPKDNLGWMQHSMQHLQGHTVLKWSIRSVLHKLAFLTLKYAIQLVWNTTINKYSTYFLPCKLLKASLPKRQQSDSLLAFGARGQNCTSLKSPEQGKCVTQTTAALIYARASSGFLYHEALQNLIYDEAIEQTHCVMTQVGGNLFSKEAQAKPYQTYFVQQTNANSKST